MVGIAVPDVEVDPPAAVKARLEAFAAEVLSEATTRPSQIVHGGLYLRGLLEQGPRKSLEPTRLRERAQHIGCGPACAERDKDAPSALASWPAPGRRED